MLDKPFYRLTAAFAAYHARRDPGATAFIRNGSPITYAAFNDDLRRMIQALAALGQSQGSIAAISHDDLYIQMLVVFGFEALGIVSGSYKPSESQDCAGLIAMAGIVLAQNPVPHPTASRMITLDAAWIAWVLAAPVKPHVNIPAASANSCLVIFRSSGTTGAPKLMCLTQRALNARLAQQRRRDAGFGLTRHSRFFATMHLSVGSMYMAAANCLRLGAIFMFETEKSAAVALPTLRPTHLTILPFHLRVLLQRWDSGHMPDLNVQCIGARLPADLRALTQQKLGGRLIENYGSNEVGSIGEVNEAGFVTLSAGVSVLIMDGERVLPPDEIGALLVRTPGMVTSYMNDAAATKTMFDDGWFAPGDLALLTQAGKLRLIGRRTDVLNLGGAKIAAAELEARIGNFPGLLDLALVQQRLLHETARIALCVVTSNGFDMAGFLNVVRPIINYPFTINPVAAIPRTQEGKIRREVLHDLIFSSVSPALAPRQLETASRE